MPTSISPTYLSTFYFFANPVLGTNQLSKLFILESFLFTAGTNYVPGFKIKNIFFDFKDEFVKKIEFSEADICSEKY